MKEELLRLEKGIVTGYHLDLGNAPLLLIQAKKGFVMCGYLNIATANTLGDVAGKVTGVKTFQDVLEAKIVELSQKAKQAGFTEGISARTFLNELIQKKKTNGKPLRTPKATALERAMENL